MSEKENNSQWQKPRVNRLALRSFWVPGLNLVIVLLGAMLGWVFERVDPNQGGVLVVTGVSFGFIASVGVFALIFTPAYGIRWARKGLRQIKKNPERFVGRRWAIAGITVSGLSWCVLVGSVVYPVVRERKSLEAMSRCSHNLAGLGTALRVYAGDYGKYPTPDKWCDLLIEAGLASRDHFKCPDDKEGPCSYAINQNAEPNSPGDMVLLFESKPGWNQAGGLELITFDNHQAKFSHILYNDHHVKWFKKPRKGRVSNLRWRKDNNKQPKYEEGRMNDGQNKAVGEKALNQKAVGGDR